MLAAKNDGPSPMATRDDGGAPVAKIRHIAYRVNDVEAMADFFIRGFEMEIAERRPTGAIDLSDGVINITLLPIGTPAGEGEAPHGIGHIGFSVEDDEAAKQRLLSLGASEARTIRNDSAHYEVKFTGPEGIVVDIGHWAGTAPINSEATPAHA
jgi:catechol 2,3-dioxygenase-like lactoylglutathione lyase family enzyme